jgi:hypothetical protein
MAVSDARLLKCSREPFPCLDSRKFFVGCHPDVMNNIKLHHIPQCAVDTCNVLLEIFEMSFDTLLRGLALTNGAAAAELGVSIETVRLWRVGKRRIPGERAVQIERKFGFSKADLRPDLWPNTGSAGPGAASRPERAA